MPLSSSPGTLASQAVAKAIAYGRLHPDWFVEKFLGESLWRRQKEIIDSAFHKPLTAVPSCHSAGKTHVSADTVISFFYCFPGCKIITTAPNWVQVEKLLWAEIGGLFKKLPSGMGGEMLNTELRAGPNWWAMGLSTDDGVRFQGHHAPKMLVIFDEAPGVRPEIWEAMEGLRTSGDVHVLCIGNPTVASGAFYDACSGRTPGWNVLPISAFDTPNFEGLTLESLLELPEEELNKNVRPYLVNRRWVRDFWYKCDQDRENPQWLGRVEGKFPVQSDGALISLLWLEDSGNKPQPPVTFPLPRVFAGVDVAGPGEDETTLWVVNEHGWILHQESWSSSDPRGSVVAALHPFRPFLQNVAVDCIGIGYYFAKHLEDLKFPVSFVNVAAKADDDEKFFNRRAELYWNLRDWFRDRRIGNFHDIQTQAQLLGIQYHHSPKGKIQIEDKKEFKKRSNESPDRAEGLMLALSAMHPPKLPYQWLVEKAAREEAEAQERRLQEQGMVVIHTPPMLPHPGDDLGKWLKD